MAYNINLTNGTNLVTVEDGNSDTNYSSIVLFGKNYAGYGELLNENLVRMLENFSYATPPANPLQGQLWWDSANKLLKVRKDASWKIASGPTASPTAPVSDTTGDLWWNETDNQLNIFNGLSWTTVGPAYTSAQGLSGPVVETVHGATDNTDHVIVKFYVNGVVTAVLSRDLTFEINVIPGFTHLKPGFNLPSVGTYTYYGNSENALSLGGVLAANFLRSDIASVTNYPLSVKTNSGFNVGLNDDFKINVAGSAVNLAGMAPGRDTDFSVNVGGITTVALRISGTTGLVTTFANPVTPTGVATKNYVDTSIADVSATFLHRDGSTSITGNSSPIITSVYSLGTDINHFASVYSDLFAGTTFNTQTGTVDSLQINNYPASPLSAATKQYVDDTAATLSDEATTLNNNTINTLIGGAPLSLSNLSAISNSIGNNPTFALTLNTAMNLLAPKDSPSLTGIPVAPTPDTSDSSFKIATTAFVSNKLALFATVATTNLLAPKDSPTFTGTPAAPTPDTSDSSTKLATTAFVSSKITSMTTAGISNPVFTGNTTVDTLYVNSGLMPTTDNTIDIGSPDFRFRYIYGRSMSAQYADLAENYVADANYEPGTVLDFGGDNEVTISDGTVLTRVAGVVSTDPAYLMNARCDGEFVVALALQGRCPVKVFGPINKGDLLVSAGAGMAKAAATPGVGTVIGKALQSCFQTEGVVEVSIGRC